MVNTAVEFIYRGFCLLQKAQFPCTGHILYEGLTLKGYSPLEAILFPFLVTAALSVIVIGVGALVRDLLLMDLTPERST